MAPRPLPQSWPSPFPPSTTAYYNGIQQWHHVQLAVTLPSPNHSTLQWHPAMAPCPLPQSWSSPSPPTIVRWHPAMAPRPLHPSVGRPGATSNPLKWFVAFPAIGSKNPFSYRYLGNYQKRVTCEIEWYVEIEWKVFKKSQSIPIGTCVFWFICTLPFEASGTT